MVDFRRTSWEDANPGFVGAARVGDIFNRILENQKLGIANRYMPGTLQAEMAKKQAEARYYGPNIESEMALRNAQGQEIYQGSIPHYQAQQRLIDMGQIPEYQAQARYHGAQATEQEQANRLEKERVNNIFRQIALKRAEAANRGNGTGQTLGGQAQNMPGQQPQMGMPNLGANSLSGALGVSRPGQPSPFEMQQPQQQVSQAPQMQQLQQQPPQMQQPAGLTLEDEINTILSGASKKGKGAAETPAEKEARAIRTDLEKEKNREALVEKRTSEAEYKNTYEIDKKNATAAGKLKEELRKFKENYDRADLKGPFLGEIPLKGKFDPYAEKAVNAMNNMQKFMSESFQGGRLTNIMLTLSGKLKPGIEMNEETVNTLYHAISATCDRTEERTGFMAKAKKDGYPAPVAESLWDTYNDEMPVYDYAKDRVNKKNLNQSRKYLTPEAVSKVIDEGARYNPSSGTSAQSNEMVGVIDRDGQIGDIPADKVELFLKENPGSRRE